MLINKNLLPIHHKNPAYRFSINGLIPKIITKIILKKIISKDKKSDKIKDN